MLRSYYPKRFHLTSYYFFLELEIDFVFIEGLSNRYDDLYQNLKTKLLSQITFTDNFFYFPRYNKYFSPNTKFLFGFLSEDLQNTKAYIINKDSVYEYIGIIKDSNFLKKEITYDTLIINENLKCNLSKKYTTFHNYALNIRNIFKDIEDYTEKNISEKIKKEYLFNDLLIENSSFKIENCEPDLFIKDTPIHIFGNAQLNKDFIDEIDDSNFSFSLKNLFDDNYNLKTAKPRIIPYNFNAPFNKTYSILIKIPYLFR